MEINTGILYRECQRICTEILEESLQNFNASDFESVFHMSEELDFNSKIWEYCDGHEWVIYTYKAMRLCSECWSDAAEDHMHEMGQEFTSFTDHATAFAFAIMYTECQRVMFDLLEGLDKQAA